MVRGMARSRFELDVRLRGIEPAIWRRVEVDGAAALDEVHFALQVAMGWTNSHLHQFVIGDKRYGMANVDGAEELKLEDERQYRLQDVVKSGDSFEYEYDFGDGWEHDVRVEKVTTVARAVKPRCVAGARACPPEDCGGTGGYENLLEALADPKHDEHDEMVEWSNGFESERFALPKGGRELRAEMARYAALARGDEAGGEDLDDVDDDRVEPPRQLVKAVLALDPGRRASLAAIIAGSLADELLQARSAMGKLVEIIRHGAASSQARGHGPTKGRRRRG